MKSYVLLFLLLPGIMAACEYRKKENSLSQQVRSNPDFLFVKEKAREVVRSGFNAGDGYGEVWIRDFNTFIKLSCEVLNHDLIEDNLLVFFRMQGEDGNIMDGFIPVDKAGAGYEYRYSGLEPRYAGHKNTVETDQESSLIQAVFKYISATGNQDFLEKKIGEKTVADRMDLALDYLMNQRYHEHYGLLWGATTADWGDVQPEHDWGVYLTDSTHYAIDIYDNAMFLIALDHFMEMVPEKREKWENIRKQMAENTRKYLWDEKNRKFIPHVYLNGSPFPDGFNENTIFYHGGTAVAIEAGLLSREEIRFSLNRMIANVRASGAPSIGLTLYPPYPEGYFKNKGMYPYGYQNGGDWCWFGGRLVQQLVKYGYLEEAYENLLPMVERVRKYDGFFEWFTQDNQPMGSGTFRGSAGVLYEAVRMLEEATG